MEHFIETARFNMIEQQIRPWDVLDDRVLEAMMAVPRERFVPGAFLGLAFADTEIPIGHGQHMLEPRIVGRMLQALRPAPTDRILEIGSGTGYGTACLARLGGAVIGLELYAELAETARANLASLGIENAEVQTGDGFAATLTDGPFDVIALAGSVPSIEAIDGLKGHLSPEGRLFAVVGEPPLMEAVLIRRRGDTGFHQESLFETCIPALANAPKPRRFVF
jgi:protein-L-isoaspartate(D-aspartate) O-methyltransferase